MKPEPRTFRPGRTAVAALLALAAGAGHAVTTWDPARPAEVRIGSLVLGDTQYTDLVVTLGEVIRFSAIGPTRTYDTYNPANGQLTIASVGVGGTTLHDVVVTVAGVVSVGGAAALADLVPNDPLFDRQWHLKNTGQSGAGGPAAKAGEDLNIGKAWQLATGTGIQIAVVDDGLDIHHPDLNVAPGKSWDFRTNAYGDPSSSTGSHGTSCGGLAAAIGNNHQGVTGVAFNARLVGYNLLAATTGSFGAEAVTKDLADNHIYTNSYGATDSNGLISPADEIWMDAIHTGTTTGRNGKGVVYTWAAGNGAPEDRSDYDGQANHPGVLAIGALTDQGMRASYSESGSNVLVAAYGGEFCDTQTTTTTDVSGPSGSNDGSNPQDLTGQPDYTRCMNGTSAATPQAAGVAALLLETNPSLSWRDVRAIFARTARKNDPTNPGWAVNAAGYAINHEYGYGVLDALAATKAAAGWINLPAQKTAVQVAALTAPLAVPDNAAAVTSTLTLQGSGIGKLEFVELSLTSDHPNVGDLEIVLTSPGGTASTVSVVHDCKDTAAQTVTCGAALAAGFRFGIVRLMDEAADGTWTLSVRDGVATQSGAVSAWGIKAHGH